MCGDLKPFAHFERARAVIHSCRFRHCLSETFLNTLFNEEIWIVQDYNYLIRTGQRRCRCVSRQSSHGRRVISLRSFFWDRPFLETDDQTSQRDYRPLMISIWLIRAPLVDSYWNYQIFTNIELNNNFSIEFNAVFEWSLCKCSHN